MFNHFSIQAALLDKILNHISNFSPDPERFEILKEQYVRGLKNFTMEQPHQHAVYYNQVNSRYCGYPLNGPKNILVFDFENIS